MRSTVLARPWCSGWKDQMAGLSRFEDNLDGFTVAHLTHQDDFGRLPHRRAQGVPEAGRIAVQFPLMHGGALVVVQELDGIFNGDDVVIFLAIDAIEQDRQSGRLARSGGPITSTIPSRRFATSVRCAGRRREEKSGMAVGITRITTAQLPR